MNSPAIPEFDPNLDLVLVRRAKVPLDFVWKAWTDPETLKKWFCPRPWMTVECELELRPGGKFYTVMQSPEGERYPGTGCVLEVEAPHRLAWTSALLPGYRPQPPQESEAGMAMFTFSAIVTLREVDGETEYTATVIHADPEGRRKHEEMGFSAGWSAAFDQLVELAQDLPSTT